MSYGAGAALQAAVWARLTGWPALAGVPVVDQLPKGGGKGTFVLIGPEQAVDAGDATGPGAEHRFTVSVITDATGFRGAKEVAVAVSDALADAGLVLARGRVVVLAFQRAVARRLEDGAARRVDLSFAARVEL
jgi:hypothetical protein